MCLFGVKELVGLDINAKCSKQIVDYKYQEKLQWTGMCEQASRSMNLLF